MKRASFSAALILAGTALLFWFFPSVMWWFQLTFAVLSAVFLVLFLIFRSRWLRDLAFYALCALLCGIVLWFPVSDYCKTVARYNDKVVTVRATVVEDPVLTKNGFYKYVARPSDGTFSQKFVFFSSLYYTDAGGTVEGKFRFSEPEDTYALENLSDGIVLSAEVAMLYQEVVSFPPEEHSLYRLSATVRRFVSTTFLRFVGESEGGFMTAVLTGDKDALSSSDLTALRETGMLHIVAVSGLHVSVFVAYVLFFLQRIRNVRLQILFSLLSLLVILLFAGITPSVVRAVIMNAVIFSQRWFSVGSDPLNRLGIAALVILLVSPHAVLSLSFELSFAASLGILLLAKEFSDAMTHWLFLRLNLICGSVLSSLVSIFAVSLAAFSFTLPLMWIRLGSYSVWSVFLSPVILPVLEICFFIALTLLLFSLCSWGFVCGLLGRILRYGVIFMVQLSSSAASLMEAVDSLPPQLVWIVCCASLLLAVVLFFFPGGKSKKKKRSLFRKGTVLILMIIAILSAYQASDSLSDRLQQGDVTADEGVLQTVFLDVGQGNCFLTLLDGEAYVVDCGGTKKPGLVASDYLTAAGIDVVEFVLISHLHDDHANGLADLCKEKQIKEIIIPFTEGDAALYAEITALAAEEGAELTVLTEDSTRTLGDSTLRLLTRHLDSESDDQNENSIVGLCEYGNFRALFTGDITSPAEKRLVSAYGAALNCDVLSVPHHGSKGSSSKTFLETTSPVYAVISVAAKNSYGHPTEEALSRLSAVGAQIFRTDKLSTVVIRSDGKLVEVLPKNES